MNLLCPNKSLFSIQVLDQYRKKFNCKFADLNQADFDKLCHKYEIILIRFTHNLKYKKNTRIKYIISPTTGLNHIDKKFFNSKFKIISLKGEVKFLTKINSTVEHTFYLLFNILRRYPKVTKFGPKKNYSPYISNELNEKTIGIIGLGRIGKKVSKIAKSFGARVIFSDIKDIAKKNSLIQVLKQSDILSFHINLTDKNHNLFSYNLLKNIKKNCIIVNTSRGEIFNQIDLLKVLNEKNALFAADVLSGENIKKNNEIFFKQLKKMQIRHFITPHVAGLSQESIYKTDQFIYKKFLKKYK